MVNQKYLDKAETLIEALPYIQRFNRKIVVVKYGGSAMLDEELKANVIKDVVLLKLIGFKPISSPLESFLWHWRRPPSFPLMPTACTPRDSTSVTSSLFTFARTISAISIVSLSVTRSPLTKRGSIPTLLPSG